METSPKRLTCWNQASVQPPGQLERKKSHTTGSRPASLLPGTQDHHSNGANARPRGQAVMGDRLYLPKSWRSAYPLTQGHGITSDPKVFRVFSSSTRPWFPLTEEHHFTAASLSAQRTSFPAQPQLWSSPSNDYIEPQRACHTRNTLRTAATSSKLRTWEGRLPAFEVSSCNNFLLTFFSSLVVTRGRERRFVRTGRTTVFIQADTPCNTSQSISAITPALRQALTLIGQQLSN